MLTNRDVSLNVQGRWSWRWPWRWGLGGRVSGHTDVWHWVEFLVRVWLNWTPVARVRGGVPTVEQTGQVICVQVIAVVACVICEMFITTIWHAQWKCAYNPDNLIWNSNITSGRFPDWKCWIIRVSLYLSLMQHRAKVPGLFLRRYKPRIPYFSISHYRQKEVELEVK